MAAVSATEPPPDAGGHDVRAGQLLRVRNIWLVPLVLATVFVALMSVIYIGSVINPTGHLHGLPVLIVDQDQGAVAGAEHVNIGESLTSALQRSSAISSRLALRSVTSAQARATMNRAGAYATLTIPATLSRSVLLAAGRDGTGSSPPARAQVTLLENSRLGSLGVSLVAGVLTPAMAKISPEVGTRLAPLATPSAHADPVLADLLANPISLTTATYRPLPDHSAVGLSAFYIALLAILSGFIGATLINNSIDAALGYATTELGPHWRQRRPVAINRRQTLLVKWAIAAVAAPIMTGILVLIAVAALGMYAPHVILLWALTALASLMIAFGTLALLAAFGSIGQLLAMILLVYLSLASSGGTIPIQALPGVFKIVGHVEPLRQVLDGTRAILYFGARGDAGLTHSLTVIALELVFWALVGLGVVSWYDHRKLHRISPDALSFVERAIDQRIAERGQAQASEGTVP
jgi:YhgE/Pip-like protein